MLSVASLLNPVKPEPRGTRLPSSPSLSLRTSSSTYGSPQLSIQTTVKKQKMNKDGAVFAKGKIKGEVNYPPFEHLDEATLREVQRFQVFPLGTIQEYSRHIPYNSEKKNFLEKTGRESFEVFQYVFKVPGDDKDYTVMWDYNIGLVRITPFFKCCKYSKTTPAKMLNLNPGLKEITHSITGGALAAQGYWMPYSCALAVCTTFCAHIAPALIPIFGPDFPSLCVPLEAPEYNRMIIPSTTVQTSTAEAEAYRLQYSSTASSPPSGNYTHAPLRTPERSTPPNLGRRLRLKRTFGGDSLYGTHTDTDLDAAASETSSGDGYFGSPVTPNSSISLSQPQDWRPQHRHNMISHSANSSINIAQAPTLGNGYKPHSNAPNPILSAIPRSIDFNMSGTNLSHAQTHNPWRMTAPTKRRAEDQPMHTGPTDSEYDGEESSPSLAGDERSDGDQEMEDVSNSRRNQESTTGGAEKNAAFLLMKLSVKDGERNALPSTVGTADADCDRDAEGDIDDQVEVLEGPRIKRRRARATSM